MGSPTTLPDSRPKVASGRRFALGDGIRWAVAAAGVVAALLFLTGTLGPELPPPARASLAVGALAVGLWGSEVLDLAVTALLAIVLLFATGAVPSLEQALTGFTSPVLYFLLGTAGLGIAAEEAGLAERLAGWLLARSRGSDQRLLLDLLVSMPAQALLVPSAISRNAVLVPVYDRVLARLGRPSRLGAAIMLTLGVLGPLASSALLSGGTSPVAAAQAIGGFTWMTWFVAVAPPYYAWLMLSGAIVWWFNRPERIADLCRPAPANEGAIALVAASTGQLQAAEWRVAAVSVTTSLLWMLDRYTHWPTAVPALLALAVLLTPRFGVTTWHTFASRAPWGTCFVLAGAVSLAGALGRSGAAVWLARGLFGALPVPHRAVPVALAIFAVSGLITLAIPNRAAAITLCVPLATAYAAGVLSAAAAGLVVMIVVDAETIYPAQTAANLLAYDRGYFSARQLAQFNALTMLAAALVVVLIAFPWWNLVGLPR